MLLLQLFLIALNAVFACAEIAVISINEQKIAKLASQGNKKAQRLAALTSRPARFLATIQVAITLSGFLGSAFAADNFSGTLADWLFDLGIPLSRSTLATVSLILITLILSYFTLVFGELVPKRLAMKKAESLALAMSGLISVISTLFAPVVWFLSLSTNTILRLLRIDPNEEDDPVSEEEILLMVDAGSKKGAIDQEEQEFIQNVFKFDDMTAEEIAIHRTEVTLLWMEESMEEWNRTIYENRFSLYPVCEDSKDHIIGILHTKDYFRLADKSREQVLASAVRPAYFVPENVKADILFRNMKKGRHSMAVVLDEYGGMIGIVTLKDLVEQLVGDLEPEEADKKTLSPKIIRLDSNLWKICGNVELESLEKAIGVMLNREMYDTFTGLVFNTLGQVPDDGQEIDLEASDLLIHVSRIHNHQIEEATIQKQEGA
ncbi:MAG: HlyC/CorC family transporter [Lachnospiraceae bacterium]|nr:HlyC/CorC family transporter [Lachnospiraceae bacterium]